MTVYVIFRVTGRSYQEQGTITASSSKKAVQKWVDQSPNPPKVVKAKKRSPNYVVIAKSNINKFYTKRRR